jgi:uncharacterized membrane protein YoaK (UPF0700 family)
VIDAVSLLILGRVFVANMTGNVVLMGFGIAGVPEFSLVTSLVAMAAFLIGAAAAGCSSTGSTSGEPGCAPRC